MKTRTFYKILILSLLFFAALDSLCQTVVKNVPIVSDDAYIVKTWAFNENTEVFGWYDILETNVERDNGWYYNKQVNIQVQKYDVAYFLFIRGFEDCKDTTRLAIHGNYQKTTIKDTQDLRKTVKVDGGSYVLGTPIVKPEI